MPNDNEKAWIEAWRTGAPRLQAIRDEELRQLSGKGIRQAGGVTVYEKNPHANGLVIMQAWFMRFQILLTLPENCAVPNTANSGTDCDG